MRAAVTAAGGVVVGDLSAIDALAVVPGSAGFGSRVASKPLVTGLFTDTLFASDHRDDLRDYRHGDGASGDRNDVDFDPWHALFQWDDDRISVQSAWRRTTGDRSIAVAVLDTGVDADHRELHGIVDKKLGGNFIPCDDLRALFGLGVIDRKGLRDCHDDDFEGHGTWVASRIARALNGFASNGVAPGVRIGSYKVLAAGLRRALELDALRSRVRVFRPAHRRREHVDRRLRRPLRSGLGPGLPALHRRGRLLPSARRARLRSRRQRARARRPRVDDDRRRAPRGRRRGLDRRPGNRHDTSRQRLARRVRPARRAARARRRPRRDDGLGHRERDRRRARFGAAALELPRRGARPARLLLELRLAGRHLGSRRGPRQQIRPGTAVPATSWPARGAPSAPSSRTA